MRRERAEGIAVESRRTGVEGRGNEAEEGSGSSVGITENRCGARSRSRGEPEKERNHSGSGDIPDQGAQEGTCEPRSLGCAERKIVEEREGRGGEPKSRGGLGQGRVGQDHCVDRRACEPRSRGVGGKVIVWREGDVNQRVEV
eukprot:1161827-Pelagomonas_calceolata.AAC.6